MNKLKMILIGLLFCLNSAIAQKKIIELWPNGIPGSIYNPSYRTVTDTVNKMILVKYISKPTMDVYFPHVEKSNGTAVLICPGGGYGLLASGHEGSQIANWMNTLGITAIVLNYRLPDTSIMINKTIGPLQDAQKAMRIIRRHAKDWHIDPNKIGIMGFSAGGHLASTLSTHYNEKVYAPIDSTSARPDFSLLIYPVISMDSSITHMGSRINLLGKKPVEALVKLYSNELQVNECTPPAFLVHSLDDNTVPVQNSINYVLALRKYNIPCELHLYEKGGHGYGLGRSNNTESTWPDACSKWLKANGF